MASLVLPVRPSRLVSFVSSLTRSRITLTQQLLLKRWLRLQSGDFKLGGTVTGGHSIDFLVAYEVSGNTGVDIAEVHAVAAAGTTANTAAMHIYAQDLVFLPGVSLTQFGLNLGEIGRFT